MIKNDLKSMQPDTTQLYGIYRGVIEDNDEPDKMGGCKIRVWGIHTKLKQKTDIEGIPTDELPWAYPAMGLFEGSISGYGSWTVPLQGSHVFLFFENGHILQPRYFATVPGKPEDQNHGLDDRDGFSDPDKNYPAEHRLNEPDFHRLARDESEETIVKHKEDNKEEEVKLALNECGGEWDEPDPYYNKTEVKYPNNKVFATHSGIIIEIDDSAKPRLHIFHPSNTYIEVDNEGNMIVKNAKDKYEISGKTKRTYIKDEYHRTVDSNRTSKVGNDEFIEIGKNETREIGNNKTETIGGTYSATASIITLNP